MAVAALVLWLQDGRYGQPTPRPEGLASASMGAQLPWPNKLKGHLTHGRPALLHFLNPDCPCSKFNLDHVRELHSRFLHEIDLIVVLECEKPPAPGFTIDGLAVPIVHDIDGALADIAGVYSTPVAVVLDPEHALVYVGNYPVTRFCTDRAGQPVRKLLEGLTGMAPAGPEATAPPVPFGCPLPSDIAEGSV